MSNGGEGNTMVIIKCRQCNTYITSNLIRNITDWFVEKPRVKKENNKLYKNGRLWNQA